MITLMMVVCIMGHGCFPIESARAFETEKQCKARVSLYGEFFRRQLPPFKLKGRCVKGKRYEEEA